MDKSTKVQKETGVCKEMKVCKEEREFTLVIGGETFGGNHH